MGPSWRPNLSGQRDDHRIAKKGVQLRLAPARKSTKTLLLQGSTLHPPQANFSVRSVFHMA